MGNSKDLESKASSGGFLKGLEEALISLKKTAKDLTFYPSAHPALKGSLDRTIRQWGSLLEISSPLTVTVAKEGFSYEGRAIGPGNPQLKELASELYFKRIQAIRFLRSPSLEALEGFLRLLLLDAKQLRDMGGIGKALFEGGVESLAIEELEFKFAGERHPPSEPSVQKAEGQEGLKGGGLEEALELVHGYEALPIQELLPKPEEPETLEGLLEKLEEAETVAQYQHFAEKLEASAKRAKEARDPEVLIMILSAFLRHLHPLLSPKPGKLQGVAKEAIDRIADVEGMELLMERLCNKKAFSSEDVAAIFTGLGSRAIPPLLDRLKEEEHLSARRRLISALIQQGASAVPFLLQALDDPRWYVVRNVALILGHIGGEEAVGPLSRQLRHQDHRVRREVVLALGRIGSPKVSTPLLEALKDQDPVACQYAISALGSLKEKKAIPALIEIARAAPKDDVALQQAAIAALGRIGGEEALHTLVDLLKKRSFLSTAAHEEVRAQAAAALGTLGTEEALEALRAEAERSSGKVLKACREALEKLLRLEAGREEVHG